MTNLVPIETIVRKILFLRREKVLLDRDLAELYGVTAKALNQAVKRNQKRFPSDFMFPLTKEERDQLVTNCDRFRKLKHSVVLPHGFTEQGVAMLFSVLNSDRAIEVNVAIMRAFVQLRMMIGSHEELARELVEFEARLAEPVVFLLYALCSMFYARPKALLARRERSGSGSAKNPQGIGAPGDGRGTTNPWHLRVSRSETRVPILVSCRHGILERRPHRGGPCGLKFGGYLANWVP